MNVLLTCAGRRNYLIGYFREALSGSGNICAADASHDAPALHEADRGFVVPTLDSPDYLEVVLDICQKHQIDLLLSLSDLELPFLAEHRDNFREIGTIPVVSSPGVVATCGDKWRTFQFLSSQGIGVPKTYCCLDSTREALDAEEISLPVIVKPRWGTASLCVFRVETAEELVLTYEHVQLHLRQTILGDVGGDEPEGRVIVQECLRGGEYGLDVVNDLEGNHACTLARRKIAMRHGETERATTVSDERLRELGRRIGESLGHVFALDCDVFVTDDDLCVLELNPRFGGGYPFSHVAGANLPAALLAWADSRSPDPSWLQTRPNVTSAKCDRLVITSDSITDATSG
jgi:carbamoyl-phosphate synthase large subunit